MATLTKKIISFGTYTPGATPKYAGLDLTPLDTPAAGGDQFLDDGNTFLLVNNADATPTTVTVAATSASDEGITTNVVVDVAASEMRALGPFGARFRDTNGYVQITYSKVTSLTVAACTLADKGR